MNSVSTRELPRSTSAPSPKVNLALGQHCFLNQASGRVPYEISLSDPIVFMLAMIAAHDNCSIQTLIERMVAHRTKEIGLTRLFKQVKDLSQ